LAPHTQILKKQKQLNGKNHHIPSILTLNISGVNTHMKRCHVVNWIKKEDLTMCCFQETHLIGRNKHRLGGRTGRQLTNPMAHKNRQR
jgi:hypothetical protein